MKKLPVFALIIAVSAFSSCQKQQTDAERDAEVERQVEQRLATERQAQEQERLAKREAELNAREKALLEKKETPEPQDEPARPSQPARIPDDSGPASYSTFYTKLEPYGAWRETSDYGYVWQPNQAERSRNWRPYTEGRWVYTDAGWTWVSQEPFGWATYHYGRWARLRNIGWVWVPGDEWAPAWVSWRKSDDYVGWAPLPPEANFDRRTGIRNWSDSYYDVGPENYCFVSTTEFGTERLDRIVVPTERNITIVNQTINVTNITYSNTTIINHGPSYDELRVRSRQPIQKLRLERQLNVNVNINTPVVRGEILAITAPPIVRAQRVERPRQVRETVAQVVVDRGWEGFSDGQAAEKTRVKIRAEATPPPSAPSRKFMKVAQGAEPASPAGAASTPGSTPVPTTPSPSPATVTSTPVPAAVSTPTVAVSSSATPASTPLSVRATPTPFQRSSPVEKSTPAPVPQPPATSPAVAPAAPGGMPDARQRAVEARRKELESRRIPPKPKGHVPMTPSSPTATPTPTPATSSGSADQGVSSAVEQSRSAREQRGEDRRLQRQLRAGELERPAQGEPTSSGQAAPTPTPAFPVGDAATNPTEDRERNGRAGRPRRNRAEPQPTASPSPSLAPQ